MTALHLAPRPRVVALHGIATTAAIWDGFGDLLPGVEFTALERPRTGDLAAEVAAIAPLVEDCWVVALSGGATLGLALAASAVRLRGAVLHEPAAGTLAPDLLTPVRDAFARGGTDALGATLYGPLWRPWMAGGHGDEMTARELSMFAGAEPAAPSPGQGKVTLCYGAASPRVRRDVAHALGDRFGYEVRAVPGAAHFVSLENPAALAGLVCERVAGGG